MCIVESGPHLDSKHAYVIVRHVKYASKKGGKKASKAMEDAGKGTYGTAPVAGNDSEDAAIECGGEAVEETTAHHSSEPPIQKEGQDRGSRRELNRSRPEPGANREKLHYANAGGSRTSPGQWGPQASERRHGDVNPGMGRQEISMRDQGPAETNRYAARRQPVRGDNNRGFNQGRPVQQDGRSENAGRYENQRPPPEQQQQQHNRPLPRFSQGGLPQDPRNDKRGHFASNNNNQRQPAGGGGGGGGGLGSDPSQTSKSFGIFSTTPKPASSDPRKTDGAGTASKPGSTDSPKSFGIFSSTRK